MRIISEKIGWKFFLFFVFFLWASIAQNFPSPEAPKDTPKTTHKTLSLMTLNIAHGRRESENQALLSKKEIQKNLEAIATVFQREQPDIIALQEADGPSFWSGKFNHVQYLAQQANYPHLFQGAHVNRMKLSYGTALLSKFELYQSTSITFSSSWPTPSKGFVLSTIQLSELSLPEVDIVSVHLDFARESTRKKQIQEMITYLQTRQRPLIVMGDFNCDWSLGEKKKAVQIFAETLQLKAFQPLLVGHESHPAQKSVLPERRIDWILISEPFSFDSYKTLPDLLSDHRAVFAQISWPEIKEKEPEQK